MPRLTVGWALALVLGGATLRGEELSGRLIVTVTEEGTGKPVPGARVNAFAGESIRSDVPQMTAADGRCEIAIPYGDLQINTPSAPFGYWIRAREFGRLIYWEHVLVMPQQPVVRRGFEATRGVLWPAKVVTKSGEPVPGVRLYSATNSFKDHGRGGESQTNDAGRCELTLARQGGALRISCGHDDRMAEFSAGRVVLDVDPEFDPAQVVTHGPSPVGDRFLLTDRLGRKASLAGCRAVVEDGRAQLVLELQDAPGPEFAGEIVGSVVDETGKPIAAATVYCHHPALVARESHTKTTDEAGGFRFRGPFKWSPPRDEPSFELTIRKEGYSDCRVGHLYAPGADAVLRVETLVLACGHDVSVRVFDKEGQPAAGANINWLEGHVERGRSDSQGKGTLKGLPAGPQTIAVGYGNQFAKVKVDVSAQTAVTEIRLQQAPARSIGKPSPPVVRLQIGASAPEWSIAEWNDGKQHSVTDYRGRIAVIEFWDYSCGPCRKIGLPVLHQLQAKFKDRGVAFVHINPAGSRPQLIQELLTLNQWDFLVGFDQGESATSSQTLQRFGVTGFSTTFILDRHGRILVNSSIRHSKEEEEAEFKAAAAAAGLPWPIEKDASEEELIRRMRRYHEHVMTVAIEKALASK